MEISIQSNSIKTIGKHIAILRLHVSKHKEDILLNLKLFILLDSDWDDNYEATVLWLKHSTESNYRTINIHYYYYYIRGLIVFSRCKNVAKDRNTRGTSSMDCRERESHARGVLYKYTCYNIEERIKNLNV